MNKERLISIIKLVVSLGLGISLVMWFVGQMSPADKEQVLVDIKRANYFWVLMGPLVGLISNYFRSERWRILLEPLGYKPGMVNTFLSVMIMYFLNLFFPRLGEVSRCGILARYEKVPVDKAIGTMVLERLVDVVCIAIVAGLLVVTAHDKFSLLFDKIYLNSKTTFGDVIAKNQLNPVVKYGVMMAVAIALLGYLSYLIRKKGVTVIVNGLKDRLLGLVQGLISIKDVKRPFMFVFHTVMIWVCYFLMTYLGFRMFPETAGLGIIAGGMCLFFSGVAFSLTPGGLGLYPIFMQLVLTLFGVTSSAAISMGLVAWSVQTAFVLIAGVLSLILLAIINRETPLEEEVTLKTE